MIARIVALTCCIAAVAAIAAPAGHSAAPPDSRGTEFWLAFPRVALVGHSYTLFISSDEEATGTIYISLPPNNYEQPFSVPAGGVTTVVLPSVAHVLGAGFGTAVHVTASNEVTISALGRRTTSSDSYLALPEDVLGTKYTVMAWGGGIAQRDDFPRTQFAIAASESNTKVTIIPADDTAQGHARGAPFVVNISAGGSYLVAGYTGDLTGSTIVADKPVAVFGGHRCANIPTLNTESCNTVIEQQPPDETWGKEFVTVPLKGRILGDQIRILASEDDTEVSIDGASVATLNASEFHTQLIGSPAQISASKPVLVAQFSNSHAFGGATEFYGDPFMILIPPVDRFLTAYTVWTPTAGFFANQLNLVVPAAAVGSVRVDGTAVPPAAYTAIGSSGLHGAQIDVSTGKHTVTGTGEPFGVFVYGAGDFDGYGHPAGMAVVPGPRVATVRLDPDGETLAVGGDGCVTASVRDQLGGIVAGAGISFAVSGANAAVGSHTTDLNGSAPFCYRGAAGGRDQITATVGPVSGYAAKTWVAVASPPPPPPPLPGSQPSAGPPPAGSTFVPPPAAGTCLVAARQLAPRAVVQRLTSTTTPRRDVASPHTFTTTGAATPPSLCADLPRAAVCTGVVTVRFKLVGRHTISSRTTRLRSDCSYRSRVTFRRHGRLRARPLRVHVTFEGNRFLHPADAPAQIVRMGGPTR